MKTIKKVTIEPVYVKLIPENIEPGKLYISNYYGTAIHLCLCGCGNEVVTPLFRDGWAIFGEKGKVTMKPSIYSKNLKCKSHYIITNNVANFV